MNPHCRGMFINPFEGMQIVRKNKDFARNLRYISIKNTHLR